MNELRASPTERGETIHEVTLVWLGSRSVRDRRKENALILVARLAYS